MSAAIPVGIRSLAISAPATIRTNEELSERHPELVQRSEQSTLGRIMSNTDSRPDMSMIDASIVPYLDDPFRGVTTRRVLGPDESSIDLEVKAGAEALELAGVTPDRVDLLISVGFLPHHVGIGNAVYVAKRLGLRGGGWNLETACAGPLTALQTAFALVRAGEYETILVTVSCAYSRFAREDDTLSWFLGDGGGAFVVSRVGAGTGYISAYTMHTGDTCGSWYYTLELDDDGMPARVMRAQPETGKILRKTVEKHLRRCCDGAAAKAGVSLHDIDFFVFHTPTAWFADFAVNALGIDPARTASVYQHYANVGPALTPINLHYAAYTKRINPGDTVLVYGPGSVSSAAAMIMRWGDVALGQPPAGMDGYFLSSR
ncbi:3-oxoacyl-[acyl-carrier-protein] synthase, KASIII [Enhygromyxa salina]|uniref:3-oxoacyl-[acyl-carrier-protein] synthase, KASIII n=1 Tax=Enhygromyxa salina TaxID=215803 RepID=A0A0C1ZPD3_9BACT|nr:3-oxoacyl-[acyl-carrier-protein] synthase III C-terminal domain-containing protein [Enhygromyxa salina]KIG12873.1 3-oxoacyl-[acyl-carrier-protein] synthase, KASIII [Enhygromyxa salina]